MNGQVKTPDGQVSSVDNYTDTGCNVFNMILFPNNNSKMYMNVNVLHELLQHPSNAMSRMMAKEIKKMMTGIFMPCKECVLGKAKKVHLSNIVH